MNPIRMLVFGPPKTGKTSNEASTFPTPVLLLNFDIDGWTSIRRKYFVCTPEECLEFLKSKATNHDYEVMVVDFSEATRDISPLVTRPMDAQPIVWLIKIANELAKHCPFQTVIVDPVTMWDSAINDFVGGMNSVTQLQIQHWGQAAKKKEEIITFINSLPCHTVFIAHEDTERDELTGAIRVIPLVTGQMKNKIGMMFSQFVYSSVEKKSDGTLRYVLWTQPKELVKGIGCRWPQGLPAVVENDFTKMFGGL